MARNAAFELITCVPGRWAAAVTSLGTECYTWPEKLARSQITLHQTRSNATIPGQSRRRTGPSAAAGGAWVFRSRGPQPVHAAGIPGVLGQAPYAAEQRRWAVWAARQSATVYISDFQSAVSDAD